MTLTVLPFSFFVFGAFIFVQRERYMEMIPDEIFGPPGDGRSYHYKMSKPFTRKTFHVVVSNQRNPEDLLAKLWQTFGNHAGRTEKHSSRIITHGDVRDGDVRLVVEYTVRGGYPSDIRRWLGLLIGGDPRPCWVTAVRKDTQAAEFSVQLPTTA